MILKNAQLLYETEINSIKQELATLPIGYLIKRGAQFYMRADTFEKGITKDPEKIIHLARKAYLIKRLKHFEWNLSLIKNQTDRCKPEEPDAIIRTLPGLYQTLPANYYYHSSVAGQLEKAYEGKSGYENELVYLTNSKIYVRSKSERTIADALDQNGIPYRYESKLKLGDRFTNPDFTIYKPADGKMVLWEHFGLMNNDEYRKKVKEKMAAYIRYGFYPNDNLICTYEKDLLNPVHIQVMIDMFLLNNL